MALPETAPRTWQLWERPTTPRPFQLQPRDVKIIEEVARYRFLQPQHVCALLQGSEVNLSRRLRLLFQHGYLQRPTALRPNRILLEQIVYAIGAKGIRLLESIDPAFRSGNVDWNKEPGLPFIDHELAIANFFVVMKLACERAGIVLHWNGSMSHQQYRIPLSNNRTLIPDAFFILEVPGRGRAHHLLELDNATLTLSRMRTRYQQYFDFWRYGSAHRSFRSFRVLTITLNQKHCDSLRKVALPIGRDHKHNTCWKSLLFSHQQEYDLQNSERILSQIFRFANNEAVSLL